MYTGSDSIRNGMLNDLNIHFSSLLQGDLVGSEWINMI
jgi:hypothetical protein